VFRVRRIRISGYLPAYLTTFVPFVNEESEKKLIIIIIIIIIKCRILKQYE
jgi:hypothetical protein